MMKLVSIAGVLGTVLFDTVTKASVKTMGRCSYFGTVLFNTVSEVDINK